MPERQANPIARIVAVIALLTAFMLVAVVFVMDSGESDSGNGKAPAQARRSRTASTSSSTTSASASTETTALNCSPRQRKPIMTAPSTKAIRGSTTSGGNRSGNFSANAVASQPFTSSSVNSACQRSAGRASPVGAGRG